MPANSSLHYKTFGKGKPLLIIHGWEGSSEGMMQLLEPLFADLPGWKRIYLDLPGHGKGKSNPAIQNSDDILGEIVDFTNKVLKNEPFGLFGYSYGSYLAFEVLRKFQNNILLYCALNPLIIANDEKRIVPSFSIQKDDGQFDRYISGEDAKIFRGQLVVQEEVALKNLASILEKSIPYDKEFADPIREDLNRYTLQNKNIPLAKVCKSPSLYILGRQDQVVGYEQAWTQSQQFRESSFHVLNNAGHLAYIEKKTMIQQLISFFIEDHFAK